MELKKAIVKKGEGKKGPETMIGWTIFNNKKNEKKTNFCPWLRNARTTPQKNLTCTKNQFMFIYRLVMQEEKLLKEEQERGKKLLKTLCWVFQIKNDL